MRSKAVVKTEEDQPATFGWLQFEKKGLQELRKLSLRAPTAMAVLLYLATEMSRSNALAVSQGVIAGKVGISIGSVNRAIKTLVEHNFIEVIKVGNLGVYRVNTRVAWQGVRGKRFAYFSAEILAIESEQDREIDDLPPLKPVPQGAEGGRLLGGIEAMEPLDQQELSVP
jgi:hypothetical protein